MENAKRYILGVIMLLALIQGCYEGIMIIHHFLLYR